MRNALLLLRKDLRVLRRSPLVLLLLLAYPVVIALLVGLVAAYANAKPRVALVDRDGLPQTVVLAGHRFDVNRTIDRVRDEVELVRLSPEEAERQLETGEVVATLTVPEGFVRELRLLQVALGERLAHFERHQSRELVAAPPQLLRGAADHGAAIAKRRAPPLLKRRGGRRQRLLDLRSGHRFVARELFPCGWVGRNERHLVMVMPSVFLMGVPAVVPHSVHGTTVVPHGRSRSSVTNDGLVDSTAQTASLRRAGRDGK